MKPAPTWAWILGTWFGAGRSPFAPGTAGTAATLPLVAALGLWAPSFGSFNPWLTLCAALLFYPSVLAASHVEAALGRHDPGAVVVDESLGTLLTFALLPPAAFQAPWIYLAGFLLFRLLDIWKPWVIGHSQALPRGWGIVMDDVLGGIAGAPLLWAAWRWL